MTVRGFGTQFNELLSNGRPIASGNGQNFDFSALGAEYVGEVDVHKTPDFALSSGAIGASIDIKSPKPFDHPRLQARAFASGTDYQKDGGVTPAFGALIQRYLRRRHDRRPGRGRLHDQTHRGRPFRHRGLERWILNSWRYRRQYPPVRMTPTARVHDTGQYHAELVPPGPGHVPRAHRLDGAKTDGWPCSGTPPITC